MRESGDDEMWYAPVPAESILVDGMVKLCVAEDEESPAMCERKTPSAIGERHMFPRQTKRTERDMVWDEGVTSDDDSLPPWAVGCISLVAVDGAMLRSSSG